MSTSDKESEPSIQDNLVEPDPSNNDAFLDENLKILEDRYSYEQLSDLSAHRLGALNPDDEGLSEEEFLHKDFQRLRDRFPDEIKEPFMSRAASGEEFEYKGLAPLTRDQRQRIQDCHRRCSRNLDRARQDALERENLSGPISKLAAWLVDFADAATPLFGHWK